MIRFSNLSIAGLALCALLVSGCNPSTSSDHAATSGATPAQAAKDDHLAASPVDASAERETTASVDSTGNLESPAPVAEPPAPEPVDTELVKEAADPQPGDDSPEKQPADPNAVALAADDNATDDEASNESASDDSATDDKAQDRTLADDSPPGRFKEQATKPRTDLPPLQADSNGVFEVTFQDLELDMPAATVYDEKTMMTDRVRGLLDQKIRVIGFIHGGSTYTSRDIKQFVMVRQVECPFGGKEGVACHAILVTLDRGIDFTSKPVTVEGVLKLNLYTGPDGNTWCVYALKGKAL
ncbi:hypothetical protein [Lignipirellula cremea]|uniref:Lipoprotein n=1 Tax=Lignipirellula cremea TaxID=2528010 RepID=A0A518DQQ5_9BACT|nr:hypothetical protein [Lignipirellula cremea]QDU94154.1 hypothetical protein Pla8534_19420 [Lignipirellula cremea]